MVGIAVLLSSRWGVAQGTDPGVVSEVRTVAGRVLRGTSSGEVPMAGQRVVLHRIGADSAGPIDSAVTSRSGGFRFTYRWAGERATYIVSTRHAGVAYFTPPLRARDVSGPEADVMVFDTTSRAVPLVVRGRHFVISRAEAEGGARRIVDVFEVANDSALTRVAGASPRGSWSVRLPDGVRNVTAGPGDLTAEALRFQEGEAIVVAPFAPGVKQVVLAYELPPSARNMTLPIDQLTGTLELLVEASGVTAAGGGLQRQETVSMEGRSFERFLGRDVPAGTMLRLTLPSAGASWGRARGLVPIALAALALTLGMLWSRRGRTGVTAPVAMAVRQVSPDDPDTLAQAIAALDAVRDTRPDAGPAALEALQRRRAGLKARLVAALDAVDGGGAPR
jgi:hypothetical protein